MPVLVMAITVALINQPRRFCNVHFVRSDSLAFQSEVRVDLSVEDVIIQSVMLHP
jgi:hypothetical protein